MKPCEHCGGPKGPNPGRGARFCPTCIRELTSRPCRTCRKVKPAAGYRDMSARRCLQCDLTLPRRECVVCKQPVGHSDAKAITCKSAECVRTMRIDQMRAAAVRRVEATLARTHRTCPACGQSKPLTREFFSTGKGDYPSTMLDTYCKACRAAVQSDRTRRARGLPARNDLRAARTDTARFPRLPALPLHRALAREAAGMLVDDPILHVCALAGIADRQMRAWGPGGSHATVKFDVADRVLTRLGWAWWDVWTPGTQEGAVAALAFEGDGSAVAA